MSTPDLTPDQKPVPAAAEGLAALQTQVFFLLIALIMVSGTFTTFLYRQTAQMGKEIGQCQQLVNSFEQNQTNYVIFVNQLGAYGQTHPEFRPVLARNGISMAPGAAPRR